MNKHYRISPPLVWAILALSLFGLCLFFVIMGWESLPGKADPKLLLLCSLLIVVVEVKFTYIESNQITIRYCFLFKRVIPKGRITSVEFAQEDGECYLLFALDGKHSLKQSKLTVQDYVGYWDRKIIRVRIPRKRIKECVDVVSRFFPDVSFVNWTGETR